MFNIRKELRDRHLIGVIADADMVTGMLLAGAGMPPVPSSAISSPNYIIVDPKTTTSGIEEAFTKLAQRRDIAVLLITQPVADRIRHLVDGYAAVLPALLEIPSKDSPYDVQRDSLLRRINRLCSYE